MAQLMDSESTSFTLNNLGRFLCNTLREAIDSTHVTVGGRRRDFDVLVIGRDFRIRDGQHLFMHDPTRSRRILVLEAGPFVLPEHVQNMPYMGGSPPAGVVDQPPIPKLQRTNLCNRRPILDLGRLVSSTARRGDGQLAPHA